MEATQVSLVKHSVKHLSGFWRPTELSQLSWTGLKGNKECVQQAGPHGPDLPNKFNMDRLGQGRNRGGPSFLDPTVNHFCSYPSMQSPRVNWKI